MKYDAVDGSIYLLTAVSNKRAGACARPAMQIFENRFFLFLYSFYFFFLLFFGVAVEMIGSKLFQLSCYNREDEVASVKYYPIKFYTGRNYQRCSIFWNFVIGWNCGSYRIYSKCIVEPLFGPNFYFWIQTYRRSLDKC